MKKQRCCKQLDQHELLTLIWPNPWACTLRGLQKPTPALQVPKCKSVMNGRFGRLASHSIKNHYQSIRCCYLSIGNVSPSCLYIEILWCNGRRDYDNGCSLEVTYHIVCSIWLYICVGIMFQIRLTEVCLLACRKFKINPKIEAISSFMMFKHSKDR